MNRYNNILRFKNKTEFINYFDSEWVNSYFNNADKNRGAFLDEQEYKKILALGNNDPIFLLEKETSHDARTMGYCYEYYYISYGTIEEEIKALRRAADKYENFYGRKV